MLRVQLLLMKIVRTDQEKYCQDLKRLERVFCCCSACETMEDYKEGYLKCHCDETFQIHRFCIF